MNEYRDDIGYLIKTLNGHLKREANAQLRAQNLTLSQMEVLINVYRSPERRLSLKQLEATLGVAQSTTWGLVARLETKGFVRTEEGSARTKWVSLTERGQAFCLESKEHVHAAEDDLLVPLSADERTILHDLLRRMCDAL